MRPSCRFTAAALFALALASAVAVHARAQNAAKPRVNRPSAAASAPAHQHHSQPMSECAAACAKCQQACDSCAAHCLSLLDEGKKAHAQTLQTCLDCAEICAAADRIVARGGPFSEIICRACADACVRCAEACERFTDDEHMAECAKECRQCANACQRMVGEETRAVQNKSPQNQSR